MDTRLALYEIAAENRLPEPVWQRLQALAGLGDEPPELMRWLARGMGVLAAALGGLGLIFWVAAQWGGLGRVGRFGLLQTLVMVMCLGAAWRPAARAPLGLLALLSIGGLFAYMGQTYQTGADAWQLFALWAAMALPLCLGARSDVLWAPWAMVALGGASLWVYAHTGHRWRVEEGDLSVHLLGWGFAAALVLTLSPLLRRVTGAGVWAFRAALTLAVLSVTLTALSGLFNQPVAPHYGVALAFLGLAALVMAWPPAFEVFGLSAVALALNGLLVAGLARWLFETHRGSDLIGHLLLMGLVATGLLSATVTLILRLARRLAPESAAP